VEIETQRWAQLSFLALPAMPGGFGWSAPLSGDIDDEEKDHDWFLIDADYMDGKVAGAYIRRGVTEFSSEPDAWKTVAGSYDDISSWVDDIFVQESGQPQRPGRIIDVDIDTNGTFNVIFVPNYDNFYRWWGWYHGIAHASTVKKILAGEAVGHIPAGSKKRLVAFTEDPNTHHMTIVVEERRKGDTYWWGVGFKFEDIRDNIALGKASADYPSVFPQDGIKKRVVVLEGHRNFGTKAEQVWVEPWDEVNPNYDPSQPYDPITNSPTIHHPGKWVTEYETVEIDPTYLFIMVPNTEGLVWHAVAKNNWGAINNYASKNNMRVIDIHPFDKDPNLFSAVLLKNSS
jgi:hypothetical protein